MIDQHDTTNDTREQVATVQVHQDPAPAQPRMLSADELKAVAGGPQIINHGE